MAFQAMQQRLIEIVRERVANGVLTESQLARLTGFSQPHIHNVLKGVKILTTELADEILRQMRLNVEDSIQTSSANPGMCASVPLLIGTLGAGMCEFRPHRTHCPVSIPQHIATQAHAALAIRLGHDPAMLPQFAAGDLILVDLAVRPDHPFMTGDTCVVMTAHGPRLRHVCMTRTHLYCCGADTSHDAASWESFPRESFSAVVQARVVWMTRRLTAEYPD